MQCLIKFIDFNTLRNKLSVSLWMKYCRASFCSWMNQYLNALPCMNEDFYALNGKEGAQFELNYHDKNTSLHVSLRTRTFDKKIHYCCRHGFLLKKIYKRDGPLRGPAPMKRPMISGSNIETADFISQVEVTDYYLKWISFVSVSI